MLLRHIFWVLFRGTYSSWYIRHETVSSLSSSSLCRERAAPVEWRSSSDLSCVYEHGSFFRCLLCDAGYFTVEQVIHWH